MTRFEDVVSGSSVSQEALLDAFDAAFADYIIPLPVLDRASFPAFVLRQGIELDASRVMVHETAVVAFALVGRRSTSTRLATMGARPEARGSGAARTLLDRVIDDARARGDRSVELEVFARNARALALYRGRGFEAIDELFGYDAPSRPTPTRRSAPPVATTAVCSLEEAATFLRPVPDDDLPFQVSARAVAVAPPEAEAWRLGSAQLVHRETAPGTVSILSLVARDAQSGAEEARALLRALVAARPDAAVGAPSLQRRATVAAAFEAEGWKRRELHQLWMSLPFGRAGANRDFELGRDRRHRR